jgi:NAD(P)-dependent dehydrogenase (short-subunit alcohol dehydrogenase family)
MAETQRVAIVTGAAGGIGRAMTRALLAAGIRVAGVDRDREPLEALAASAREQGKAADLLTIQTDLTSDTAAEEITKATRDRFGRIDILVNNAGIGPELISSVPNPDLNCPRGCKSHCRKSSDLYSMVVELS